MTTYELSIYDWPAMTGAPCHIEWVNFSSPEKAKTHIESVDKDSFSYATLCKRTGANVDICDWEGNIIQQGTKTPLIKGNRGYHPAYIALKNDIPFLLKRIKEIHKETKKGTMFIAENLLKERHPQICGWAQKLGWDAAGDSS